MKHAGKFRMEERRQDYSRTDEARFRTLDRSMNRKAKAERWEAK